MLRTYYSFQAWHQDQENRIESETYKSKSFVKAFLQTLYTNMNISDGTIDVVDIDNATKTNRQETKESFLVKHPGLDATTDVRLTTMQNLGDADTFGIVLGTSTQAVAPTDYALISQINHGTGAGQMNHHGTWVQGMVVNSGAGTAQFEVERIFQNNSNATITVNEIGMYGLGDEFSITKNCYIRDVLSTGAGVLVGEYLKLKYILKINV